MSGNFKFLLFEQVNWQITGPSDGVRTTSGSLIFQPSEDQKNIIVVITPDDIPELEKVYSLEIVSVDGGADLDPAHDNVTFKIRFVKAQSH